MSSPLECDYSSLNITTSGLTRTKILGFVKSNKYCGALTSSWYSNLVWANVEWNSIQLRFYILPTTFSDCLELLQFGHKLLQTHTNNHNHKKCFVRNLDKGTNRLWTWNYIHKCGQSNSFWCRGNHQSHCKVGYQTIIEIEKIIVLLEAIKAINNKKYIRIDSMIIEPWE